MNSRKDSLLPSLTRLGLGLVLAFGLAMVFSWVFASPVSADAPDSKGTDFWLAFPVNSDGSGTQTLFITGEIATTGVVTPTGFSSIPFRHPGP